MLGSLQIKYNAGSYLLIILDMKLTSYITKDAGRSVSHYNLVAESKVPKKNRYLKN